MVGVGRSSIGRHAKCRFSSFPPRKVQKKLGYVSDSKSDDMQRISNSDSTNIFSAIIKAPTVNPDDVCHDDPAPEQTGSANPGKAVPSPPGSALWFPKRQSIAPVDGGDTSSRRWALG